MTMSPSITQRKYYRASRPHIIYQFEILTIGLPPAQTDGWTRFVLCQLPTARISPYSKVAGAPAGRQQVGLAQIITLDHNFGSGGGAVGVIEVAGRQ